MSSSSDHPLTDGEKLAIMLQRENLKSDTSFPVFTGRGVKKAKSKFSQAISPYNNGTYLHTQNGIYQLISRDAAFDDLKFNYSSVRQLKQFYPVKDPTADANKAVVLQKVGQMVLEMAASSIAGSLNGPTQQKLLELIGSNPQGSNNGP